MRRRSERQRRHNRLHVEYGISSSYGNRRCHAIRTRRPAPPGSNFTSPTAVSGDFPPLSTEQTYHYRVVVDERERK